MDVGAVAEVSSVSALPLVEHLSAARIESSGESFVRVERERESILAHPGSTRPTRLAWSLPPAPCRRHLDAEIAIAPACRGVGDGVDFEARAGDRVVTGRVPSSGEAARLELDIDPPSGGDEPGSVELVLSTSSGPAHDTRCDWAVWIAPQVSCWPDHRGAAGREAGAPPDATRVLDLGALGEGAPFETRWDELNVWKLYTFFGPGRASTPAAADRPGWLRKMLPWATHVRVLAALGGNSCRHIRDLCLAGVESVDHPFRGRCWEGADGRAASYEILHDDTSEEPLVFTTWKAALDDLLASGMLPHLNLSAAPCALTGGHEYRTYHWNQRPVVRHEAWRAFVESVATQIASVPSWPEWRFSITNEPNCLWIDGRIDRADAFKHLGFLGSSDEYAAHFVETEQALRSVLPRVRIQLGNFTIGGKFSLEDNLPEYLGTLAEKVRDAGVAASEFSAISFSLYETPQHGLAEMPAYKFGRLRRWIGGDSPFRALPLKLDEAEIHPLVLTDFKARTGADLDATRWAAGWHADLLALVIQEHVVSVAPWLGRLFGDEALRRPHPKFWTYALASLAAGDVRPASGRLFDPGSLRPRGGPEERNLLVAVHRAAADAQGIGYVVTREPTTGVHWLLVWRHDDRPVTDEVANAGQPVTLRIVPASSPALLHIEAVELGARGDGAEWQVEPWRQTGLMARRLDLEDGALVIGLPPESVHLIRVAG